MDFTHGIHKECVRQGIAGNLQSLQDGNTTAQQGPKGTGDSGNI
jgi:hypothetical protein